MYTRLNVVVKMLLLFFFVFNDTATTEIYTYRHTLSLHDALPIYRRSFNAPGGRWSGRSSPPAIHPGKIGLPSFSSRTRPKRTMPIHAFRPRKRLSMPP